MVEYQTAIDNLVRAVKRTLEAEVSQMTLSHRTRMRGLQNIAGMDKEIHKHRYMVEIINRAGRDIWEIFQSEIRELRDNG